MMRSFSNYKTNERGSSLMAVLVIGSLLMAAMVAFEQRTTQFAHASIHRLSSEKSLSFAEGGLSKAMDSLRSPRSMTQVLPGTTSNMTVTFMAGQADVSMTRDSVDGALVTLVSTGTSREGGLLVTSVVSAVVRSQSVGDFFAVVPTTLQIAPGTDLSQASVYARDLRFQRDPTGLAGASKIKQAFYSNSYQPVDAVESGILQIVQAPAAPIRLSWEPNLVQLDATLRNHYLTWAGSDQLTANDDLSGTLVAPSNPYGVYFCPGDLTVGGTGPLAVEGSVILYSQGIVTISADITANGGSWLAIIAERGIVLSGSAPSNLQLNATLLTGGAITAASPVTPRAGTLNFNGGFQAQGGASFAQGWPTRVYVYTAPPASMPLPFFLSVEDYKVVRGKFNQ